MTQHNNTIEALFKRDHNARQGSLDVARFCASLVMPWILPPLEQQADQPLPEHYSSVGPRGVQNLIGKMTNTIFPIDTPWHVIRAPAKVRFDRNVPPEFIQAIETDLYIIGLIAQAKLETETLGNDGTRNVSGFRTKKNMALEQLIVTGDVLEYMDDNYRIRSFRRDHYVTKRNPVGDPIYHITVEKIDPLTLSCSRPGQGSLRPQRPA